MINRHEFKTKLLDPTKALNRVCVVTLSLIVGCLNGLFGGGGGMLVVPILSGLCGLEVKKAHASAIVAILPLCIASAIVYWTAGYFDWKIGAFAGIGVVIGGAIGSAGLKKISSGTLSALFYGIMLAAGVKMLIG